MYTYRYIAKIIFWLYRKTEGALTQFPTFKKRRVSSTNYLYVSFYLSDMRHASQKTWHPEYPRRCRTNSELAALLYFLLCSRDLSLKRLPVCPMLHVVTGNRCFVNYTFLSLHYRILMFLFASRPLSLEMCQPRQPVTVVKHYLHVEPWSHRLDIVGELWEKRDFGYYLSYFLV